jgi:hypothetical protein
MAQIAHLYYEQAPRGFLEHTDFMLAIELNKDFSFKSLLVIAIMPVAGELGTFGLGYLAHNIPL